MVMVMGEQGCMALALGGRGCPSMMTAGLLGCCRAVPCTARLHRLLFFIFLPPPARVQGHHRPPTTTTNGTKCPGRSFTFDDSRV